MTHQALRELVVKWRAQCNTLATGVPDFSDGIAAGKQECADDIDRVLALLGEQREAQGADLTNLKKALIKQLSRDAYCHLGDQTELRKAAEDIGIFIKLSKEGPEEN